MNKEITKNDGIKPGRFASYVLKRFLPEKDRDFLLRDFEDDFVEIVKRKGSKAARRWYWAQIFKTAPQFFSYSITRSMAMFRNYLKVALRNIYRNRSFTVINITGLAVGMACSILIALWIWNELGYDRHHDKADQIYRVEFKSDNSYAVTSAPMAQVLKDTYPEVLEAVRISQWNRTLVRYDNIQFTEDRVLFADSTIFRVFTIPFLKGDSKTALKEPNSVVISENTAEKYFGSENPIGKIVRFGRRVDLKITGIIAEAPENAHFHYDFIGSFNTLPASRRAFWGTNFLYTYVLLPEDYPPGDLENKFTDMVRTHVAPQLEDLLGQSFDSFLASGRKWGYSLNPIKDIHLHSDSLYEMESNGNMTYIYIFSAVALFIIMIACVNFMNLTTAVSTTRTKEIGLRKVMGSQIPQLLRQFLSESVLISMIALVLAIITVMAVLPAFSDLVGKNIGFQNLDGFTIILSLFIFTILIGLAAGSYPAFFMAMLDPVRIIKGKISFCTKNRLVRNILVVIQFVISILIILSTLIVNDQLRYIQNKELGFDSKRIMVIRRAYSFPGRRDVFKERLLQDPDIIGVTIATAIPGGVFSANTHHLDDVQNAREDIILTMFADYDFAKTLDLKIKDGRYFSKEISSDTIGVVINEAAVKAFDLTDPVGKILVGGSKFNGSILVPKKIIGVLEDFHFESLHNRIKPFMVEFIPGNWGNFVLAAINSDNTSETVNKIESIYKEFSPEHPFNYTFLDENLNTQYLTESKVSKLFAMAAGLAIFIACLGLFGLISFTTLKRKKEIGIRKTIGSSESQIIYLLSRETICLVAAAGGLALPAGYYLMNNWLRNFAFQMPFSLIPFIQTMILIIFVAFLTVSYQSIKAAKANPVDSLKCE
ncbi:MAG: FtsX-like permease family protein [bacterium]|nr:FtsX-like permease family protein [bacterium]